LLIIFIFIKHSLVCDRCHIVSFEIITGCDYTTLVEVIIQQGMNNITPEYEY